MTRHRAAAAAVIAMLVAGCMAAPTTPLTTTPSTSLPAASAVADRVAGWRSDLAMIVPTLMSLHPHPFHGTPRSVIDETIAGLVANAPTLTDDALMVGVLRTIALVSARGRDGHTGAFVWGEGRYPLHSLPLRLWSFPEGLFITAALPPYERLVGTRITAVAGQPIADVLAAVEPLVPRDNDATVRLISPRFVLIPEILHGLGLVGESGGPIDIATATGGQPPTVDVVQPVAMAAYNAWAGAYGLDLPPDPAVMWLSRSTETLWFRDLNAATAYVQYNRVQLVDPATLEALSQRLAQPGLREVIVDTRNNYGGEMRDLDAVLAVFRAPGLAPSAKVALLTGRNTFSAGSLFAARLQAMRPVIVLGEPAAGSPSFWDNARPFTLPFSGIVVECSTGFDAGVSADDPRPEIAPDRPVALTAADYVSGRDPVLEAALAPPAGGSAP